MADQSYYTPIVVVIAVSLALTTATTCLRIYTRARVLKKVGWEDWAMILATVSLVIMGGAAVAALKYGILQNRDDIPWSNLIALGHVINTIIFVYVPAIAFAKLSILLQMMRIFTPIHGTKSWYSMIVFTSISMLYYLGDFIAQFITCFPRSKTMGEYFPGMCPLLNKVAITGVVNTVSDFCMLALPIFWITRMRMSPAKKVVACAVFTVGALACAATIIRLVFTFKYTDGDSRRHMRTNIQLAICKAIEVVAGIICGNLPWMPAFVRHLKGKHQSRKVVELGTPRMESPQKTPSNPDKMPDLVFLEDARSSIV